MRGHEQAQVVKLVDAGDSKSPAARRAGSIPAPGTIVYIRLFAEAPFYFTRQASCIHCVRHCPFARGNPLCLALPRPTIMQAGRRVRIRAPGQIDARRRNVTPKFSR